MSKNSFALVWVRWIAVLPGALCGGLLATFPLHWMLYDLLNGNDAFIQISPDASAAIEMAVSPFIITLTYVLVGFGIAPKYKFKAAVALALLYALSQIGVLIFAQNSGVQLSFSGRSVGPAAGVVLGLVVLWHKSKHDSAQARSAAEKPPIAL